MKIGITFDTMEDYNGIDTSQYCDFASLTSISFLKKQFELAGFDVELIGTYEKLSNLIYSKKLSVDYIYNTAEGLQSRNREGLVPALLEANRIPYIGSDAYSLSLSLNKYHTKLLAKSIGIPTPPSTLIYLYDSVSEIKRKLQQLSFPIIVKPNYEGSSMGIYYTETAEDAYYKIRENQKVYRQEILCETYIDGMEITVPIIGMGKDTKAVGVVEFYYNNCKPLFLFTSNAKHYADIRCREAILPLETINMLKKHSESIHNFLGCRDINRIDFRVSSKGDIYFLEANPLPALDPEGSFCCAAKIQEISFPELLKKIVKFAEKRYHDINYK